MIISRQQKTKLIKENTEIMQQFRNSIISLKCCITALPVVSSFKLVDARLIFMLLYDSLNLIISVVHQSHLGCWGHRSEKVKLRGLDYVAYKMCQCQCAVLLKDKNIIRIVFGSY